MTREHTSEGAELTQKNKVRIAIVLITLAFAVIGYQVRTHLDEQFELLVLRSGQGVGETDFIHRTFSAVMEGDPIEDQKRASERAEEAKERQKKRDEEAKKKES